MLAVLILASAFVVGTAIYAVIGIIAEAMEMSDDV